MDFQPDSRVDALGAILQPPALIGEAARPTGVASRPGRRSASLAAADAAELQCPGMVAVRSKVVELCGAGA